MEKYSNCLHPKLTNGRCEAVHNKAPECDCRWCVYNKEFNQANSKA